VAVEKSATCPSCGHPVRLTIPELEDKRGFCAVCETTFDIRREMLGGGPFREGESLALLPLDDPPSKLVRQELLPDGATRIVLRKSPQLAGVPLMIMPLLMLFAIIRGGGHAPSFFVVFLIMLMAACFFAGATLAFGREEVDLLPDRISRRFKLGPLKGRTTTVAMRDVERVQAGVISMGNATRHCVKLLRPGDAPVIIAASQPEEVAQWLAKRIDRERQR
jgi:hypothetical protein